MATGPELSLDLRRRVRLDRVGLVQRRDGLVDLPAAASGTARASTRSRRQREKRGRTLVDNQGATADLTTHGILACSAALKRLQDVDHQSHEFWWGMSHPKPKPMGCCDVLPGSLRGHPQLPALPGCLLSASPGSCRSSHAGPSLPLPHIFTALPSSHSPTSFLLHFTSYPHLLQPTIPSSTLRSWPSSSSPTTSNFLDLHQSHTIHGLTRHQRASRRPHHRLTAPSTIHRSYIQLEHFPYSFGQLRFLTPGRVYVLPCHLYPTSVAIPALH
jgi:hypothetical protein